MGNIVTVTNVELTVDGKPVTTVGSMMFLKIRVDYAGGPNGIMNEDFFIISIDNSANDILEISGIGNSQIDIHGDDPIGKVGERFYKNEANGNYSLIVVFDDGYNNHFGGNQPGNITGWLETSIFIEYKGEVLEPGTKTTIEIDINGIRIQKELSVKPGGGSEPGRLDNSGYIINKSWRYGDHSGNLADLPEVPDNDYARFEPFSWRLFVAYQNLTWRDLRASGGEKYFTTKESLEYSNNNPTGERYQSAKEPYLEAYAKQISEVIDTPYHHMDAEIDDYLAIGIYNNALCSSHEYVKDSLRIIRVVGREENNAWWGRDAYRPLVDSNFLVYEPDEPIDRFLTEIYFEGFRGLNIDEFLALMHQEGQLLDKTSVDEILMFDYVDNSEAPFVEKRTIEPKIAHFKLLLGNLFFGDTNKSISLKSTDNKTVFANIPAKNLPYAYWVYFDTNAVEAILDHDSFNYYNVVKFKYNEEIRNAGSTNLWVKIEDASGGSAVVSEVRLKKVDESGFPLPGIKFVLTKLSVTPPIVREAVTTINGTASFTLDTGRFRLEEVVPEGSGLVPLAPLEFEITSFINFVNLKELVSPDYPNWNDLDFKENVNILTNKTQRKVCVTFTGSKKALGKELKEGQFSFVILEGETVIAKGTNNAEGEIIFTQP